MPGATASAALGLGGCEANPHNFQPFGGFEPAAVIKDGEIDVPDAPGIGVEARPELRALFHALLDRPRGPGARSRG